MTPKYFIFAVVLISILGALLFLSTQKKEITTQPLNSSSVTPINKQVNIQANFKIITKGTIRIFTDPKYHNLSEDVYIESADPSVVYVKKAGITWGNFFNTLPSPMKVTKECLTTGTNQLYCTGDAGTLTFSINGIEDPNLLNKEIKAEDNLLIEFK